MRYSKDRASILQRLESRKLLAAFGTPWPETRNLSISIAPDEIAIGQQPNQLNSLLDGIADREQWVESVLRAYQTWSVHADINVGLTRDYGVAFGTPGKMIGDPRFGEFRIGAIPQTGLLANSIPFQAAAGTFSGDLVLNTNESFVYHDWSTGQAPDPNLLQVGDRDLFSVLLHEAGNTLGVEDNDLEWSVMFRQYSEPKGLLSAEDIAEIVALYGQRSDPYELVDNGEIQSASSVQAPVGFDPATQVLGVPASLREASDVDVYRLVPANGADQAEVRVRAKGLSLLKARLEVFDASGTLLGTAVADSVLENDVTVALSGLANHQEIFVQVSALDANDVFSFGDYELEIDYRSAAVRATDPTTGAYDSGAGRLLEDFSLSDAEVLLNDSIVDAFIPDAVEYEGSRRYEVESSFSSDTDVDYFRIQAPQISDRRLVVHVAGVGIDSPDVQVELIDASGGLVQAAGRLRADGTYSLEVAQPDAGADYYLKLSVDPNSTVSVGNYVAVAEFEGYHTQMNSLVSGHVDAGLDEFYRWTATKSRLFRFDLGADGSDENQAVRITIYDAHTRDVKLVAVTRSGITRTAFAWLDEGDYIIRVTALSVNGAATTGVGYSLSADGVSDDQDNDGYDPDEDDTVYSYDPEYVYEYEYEEPYYDYTYDYDYGYDEYSYGSY